jgi:hypothetical protein
MANSLFYDENIVKDENAPVYYSTRAIRVFSILCGVLFGSIMMAINLGKATEEKKGVGTVIGFGILFTIIEIYFLKDVKASFSLTYVCNLVGSYILNYLFWNKYIGTDTQYRAKPIWIPTIIGVILIGLFVLAIVLGERQ